MSTKTDDRVELTPRQLNALMPKGKMVHTFVQCGFALIGGDWKRSDIMKEARKHGAELSGPQATAMKHGAVINRPEGPLFIETIPQAE